MGLEHRARPCGACQFHPESVSTEHGRTLVRNFRDLTRAHRRSPARRAATRAAEPTPASASTTARSRRWCDPEVAFVALYGDHDHAVWLDSSRAEPGLARFSFMGAPDGPLGQVVRYDVATRALTIERAGGREELRESVLDYCERELARLRADAPELPFDFTCGYAGYLGYELKAERGGELVHRSPLPDAVLAFCDRVIAFDHDQRRVHLVALADAKALPPQTLGWRRPNAISKGSIAGAPRAAGARCAVVRRARGSRRLPGQHRRLQARDLRGRDLRGLPDHRAAQRWLHRSGRGLSRPARAQPRAIRGAAAPRRRVGAQLLARALPAGRPRADRRVEADQGHRPARRSPAPRTRTAPPPCVRTTSRAPRTS